MLWDASVMRGYAIEAQDGRPGTVSDFLFEDAAWMIRWLVVATGIGFQVAKSFCQPAAGESRSSVRSLQNARPTQRVSDDKILPPRGSIVVFRVMSIRQLGEPVARAELVAYQLRKAAPLDACSPVNRIVAEPARA
jgi:hypothetical protein